MLRSYSLRHQVLQRHRHLEKSFAVDFALLRDGHLDHPKHLVDSRFHAFRAAANLSVRAFLLLISVAPCIAVTRFLMAGPLPSCSFIVLLGGSFIS